MIPFWRYTVLGFFGIIAFSFSFGVVFSNPVKGMGMENHKLFAQDTLGKPQSRKIHIKGISTDSGKNNTVLNKDTLAQKDTNPIQGPISNGAIGFSGHRSLHLKSPNLPVGIRNPKLVEKAALHPFSEFWAKEQIKDSAKTRWFSPEGSMVYGQVTQKAILQSKSNKYHGNERKIRAGWILWVLLFIILLLTFIKIQFPNDLRILNDSLFNDRLIRDDRELRFLRSPSSILTLLSFCFSLALLAYFYFRDQDIQFPYQGFPLFWVLCLGLLVFFSLKIFLLWIMGLVFNLVRAIQSYLSLNYIVMANFTILICPFLLIYALNKTSFVHYLLVWIPFLVLIFFTFLYVRSILFIISNYRFSKFYLFLYFCAVEICPLLLVFKVIFA